VFVRYKENTTKQFRINILDLDYIIYSFVIIFNKLKKSNTINLYFYNIRNILLDRKLKNKLKIKILNLKK
jgi:hypothetical protein